MTFLYRYQDHERGVLVREITASSLSDAYSVLRRSGIRPMTVWAKPGFLNRVAGIGKRGIAIVALSCIVIVAAAIVVHLRQEVKDAIGADPDIATPLPRQQCPEVNVRFKYESERVLSLFARPGDSRLAGTESDTKGRTVCSDVIMVLTDLDAALKDPIRIEESDTTDVVLMKRMVSGLKDEARKLVAAGNEQSVILGYFLARQKMEASYRRSILQQVREAPSSIHDANVELRAMGLKEIDESECLK